MNQVLEPEVKIEPEMNSPVPAVDEHLEDKLEEIHISDSEEKTKGEKLFALDRGFKWETVTLSTSVCTIVYTTMSCSHLVYLIMYIHSLL